MPYQDTNQPVTAQTDFVSLETVMFREAHNYLYRCRHYLLTHGGPGDVHNTLTSQFLTRAQALGVYVSEDVAAAVAYWVNWWVNCMRQDQLPLGLRFTNAQKHSARSRAQTALILAYRAHARAQIAAALGRSQRSIRSYLANPFVVIQADRRLIAQPQPRPKPSYTPAFAAAICYLWIPPSKEIPEKKEGPKAALPHPDLGTSQTKRCPPTCRRSAPRAWPV